MASTQRREASSPAAVRPRTFDFWAQLPRNGRFLISSVGVESFGRGLILPFGIVYLHEVRHFDLDVTGALLGIPALVALFVVFPAGALIDRLGPRLVIMLAAVCQIIGNLALSTATTPASAGLALAFTGVAFGCVWPAVNAMIAALVPSGIRQRYYGVNFGLVNLGIGVGGAASGLLLDVGHPGTFTLMYQLTAVCYLAPLLVLAGPLRRVSGRVAAPAASGPQRTASYRSILRTAGLPALLVTTFLITFLGYGQMEAGFTAYARLEGHVSTRVVGLAFAANTATIVLVQLAVLRRIEGRRRTRVLLAMCAVWAGAWATVGLAGLAWQPATWAPALFIVAGAAIFGLGETLMQPTLPAITNDLAPAHLRGRFNAASSGAFQVGALTAPVAAGVLFDRQLGGVFIGVLVGGCAALALFVWRVLERRMPSSANGHGH